MDDLSEKLDRLLSSPDTMERIGEMMAAFGGVPSPAPPEEPPVDADLPPIPAAGGLYIGQLLSLLPLIEQFQKEDESARLLKALRPFLAAERQKRLDDASGWLKIARLLPLLTDKFSHGRSPTDE